MSGWLVTVTLRLRYFIDILREMMKFCSGCAGHFDGDARQAGRKTPFSPRVVIFKETAEVTATVHMDAAVAQMAMANVRVEGCRRTSSEVVRDELASTLRRNPLPTSLQKNEVRCSALIGKQVDKEDCDKHSGVYWEKILTERSPFRYDSNGDQRCYDIITTMQKRTYSCRAKRSRSKPALAIGFLLGGNGKFRTGSCTAHKKCEDEVKPEQVIMYVFLTGSGGLGVRVSGMGDRYVGQIFEGSFLGLSTPDLARARREFRRVVDG